MFLGVGLVEGPEISLRAVQVVVEELIEILERSEPKLSKKLFQRVARRARRDSVPDISRGLAGPEDLEADREVINWLVDWNKRRRI